MYLLSLFFIEIMEGSMVLLNTNYIRIIIYLDAFNT